MASDDEEIQRLDSEPPPPGETTDAKTRVGELPEGFLKTLRQGADPLPEVVSGPPSGRGPVSSSKGASSWSKAPAAAPPVAPADAPATVPPPGGEAVVRGERVPSLSDAVEESELTVMHSSALESASDRPPAPPPPAAAVAPGSLAPSGGFPMAASSTPPARLPSQGPGPVGAVPSVPPPSNSLAAAAGASRASQNVKLGIVALLILGGGVLAVAFALLND